MPICCAIIPSTLANLVFSLFPFFRHTISSVRIAVIGALNTLLSLPARHVLPWIDERVFRIVYQNLIVEERLDNRTASLAAWATLFDLLTPSTTGPPELVQTCGPHLPGWLDTLMTPVGTAVDTRFFWKPSAAEGIGLSGVYDVDKPVLLQDMALVSEEQTLQGRLAGATALALLFSRWPAEVSTGRLYSSNNANNMLPASRG
jgi:TATA-binding protein-associated factor